VSSGFKISGLALARSRLNACQRSPMDTARCIICLEAAMGRFANEVADANIVPAISVSR
jgi:hypothetical protein